MTVSTVTDGLDGGGRTAPASHHVDKPDFMEPVAEGAAARPDLPPAVVAAFCDGDVQALGAVYDHFSRAVWSLTMSVLRNKALAEDAVQETFMRAWKGAAGFDPQRPIAPWLMTIARRTALDVHRREFRPTRGDHAEEQEIAVNLPGIERSWETWEIRLALDQLPEEERLVMAYAHFQGLTQPQIADKLGVPVGTVKSRSFRAHKRLAVLLSHLVDQEGGSQ